MLEIVRQSWLSCTEGVEEHRLQVGETQVAIKITWPAKIIADCFKFRSRVGMEATLKTLRDALHQKKVTHRDLWHYADINRVPNVMRP
ncbi:MAG: hypothetical protein EOP50_14175 [Sphingobacteriales bacterium]|nr:MAG: hypothetical protein EOP50_14175 [Sphingobacteriales bacterium]